MWIQTRGTGSIIEQRVAQEARRRELAARIFRSIQHHCPVDETETSSLLTLLGRFRETACYSGYSEPEPPRFRETAYYSAYSDWPESPLTTTILAPPVWIDPVTTPYKPTLKKELFPWRYAAGVELTFMPVSWEKSYKKDTTTRQRNILYEKTNKFQKLVYKDELHSNEIDDHCVELPTKVMENWAEAERIYNKVRKIADKEKLVPLLNNVCSGGGHIHISIGKGYWYEWCKKVSNLQNFQKQVYPEIANRPWLSWVFNDPVDEDINLRQENAGRIHYSKSEVVSISSSEGLEFRFFAAADDWQEQEEHLAFAQAFFHQLWSRRDEPAVELLYPEETWSKFRKHFSYARCCEEFEQLIKELGLPWARYKHYVKEYLKIRFERKEWLI